MSNENEIRERVSKAYGHAVKNEGSCCSCNQPAQKGAVALLAGYSGEELSALPSEAVTNSFGCGNPLAFSEVKEGDVVLDLGSGAGIDLLIAGKKVGPSGKVIGIDMTDDMLERARANIAEAGLDNAEVRKGIIEDLPVEDSSVDWVISNCVINLSPEKHKVFAEIFRVLKPGGRMRVSDIVAHGLPDYLRADHRLYNSCIAGAISEEDYLEGLRQAGMTDVEVVDRLVYDKSQLEAFIQSDLIEATDATSGAATGEGAQAAPACACSAELPEGMFREVLKTFAGNVWSAKVAARKPE